MIWYKANLTNSIQLIQKGEFSIWLKINKEAVSTDKDVFMCAAYIPPSESPYHNESSFSILEDEISRYQSQGNVLICGDLNARTGTEPDLIHTKGDKHIPGQINIPPPSHLHRRKLCPLLLMFSSSDRWSMELQKECYQTEVPPGSTSPL